MELVGPGCIRPIFHPIGKRFLLKVIDMMPEMFLLCRLIIFIRFMKIYRHVRYGWVLERVLV